MQSLNTDALVSSPFKYNNKLLPSEMLKVSILALLVVAAINQQQLAVPQSCPCGEGGKCLKDKKEDLYCKCSIEFIGK